MLVHAGAIKPHRTPFDIDMRQHEKIVRAPERALLAVCMATYIALLLLPLVFGGNREDPFLSYRIMWLNLLGHHYSLPPETPKPLFAALCGLLWHGALYPVMCAFAAGVLWLLMKLAVHFGAPYWAGLAAFLLFVFANTTVLPEFILPAYYPMLYFFLLLAAAYAFVKKRAVYVSLFLLGAGLVRPEAWAVPPLLMLLSRFKKERGFSWWYALGLAAPLLWAWFDFRISGSPTYSSDVTQDYLASLGMMPVTFAHYWPATLYNVTRSFFWPVHLLGLAGLCYFTIRKRTDDHFLMGALVVVPFCAFWFLSFVKPVIVHVRFLSFPMLLCCLYAALVMAECISSKLVFAAACVALLNIGFRRDTIRTTFDGVRNDNAIEADRKETLVVLRKLVKNAEVVLCGRSVAYFSYYLGEEASNRILMFREVAANSAPVHCISRGIAVYIQNDLGGADMTFMSLMIPRPHSIRPFGFLPVYKTANGTAIVYVFQRLPNLPLPQDCTDRLER